MSARLNRSSARTMRAIHPPRRPAAPQSGTSLRLSSAVTQAQSALHECIGALCAIEVTLHSLELQNIAPAEQEVLKRALQAVSCVQEWLVENALRALIERPDSNHPHPDPLLPGFPARSPSGERRSTKFVPDEFVPEGEGA